MRRAAKVDSVQTEIVEGLRKAGYRVEIIGKPVDLLVGRLQFRATQTNGRKHIMNYLAWITMEVKTPTKTGRRRKRNDQGEQDSFIEQTGTPVVTSLGQALEVMNGL